MELEQIFQQIETRLQIMGAEVLGEPIIDKEYNMVTVKVGWHDQWLHTVNIWVDTCQACGHTQIEYEVYDPEQSEESDPDPKFETKELDELMAYLRG